MLESYVNCNFDGGNIIVREVESKSRIRLSLRADTSSGHSQWFYFSITGTIGRTIELHIEDLATSSYPEAWKDYQACISADTVEWRRAPTTFKNSTLSIKLTFTAPRMYVAYFAPYSQERKDARVAKALCSKRFGHEILGESLDGRPIECLSFGTNSLDAAPVWIIARQHPGETMASWWMEGALDFLEDTAEPIANAIDRDLSFYLVPMMNPDGAYRGHLRTNAAGTDLNRAWAEPDMETSPEVALVRNRMDETGVRLFVDVHGDETLPHTFIDGSEGAPSATKDSIAEVQQFKELLARLTPDFQTEFGYEPGALGQGSVSVASNQIFERFGALSITLEMPFKDNNSTMDKNYGWSPARCKHLARHTLHAIWLHLKAS